MKTRINSILAVFAFGLMLGQAPLHAQPQRAGQKLRNQPALASPAVEQALLLALAGPDGEYAAYAEYAAILAKHGAVQPYASIILAEERHIAALTRQFEIRGLVVPENPYLGKIEIPATLKEAAQAGVDAEKRNVALYDQLLNQVKGQAELVRVFTHLQAASRECHLPAFIAAAANDGQLDPGSFACGGMGCGQQRGGPPARAGGQGRGVGRGQGSGSCPVEASSDSTATTKPGCGLRCGGSSQCQAQ